MLEPRGNIRVVSINTDPKKVKCINEWLEHVKSAQKTLAPFESLESFKEKRNGLSDTKRRE